jgi:hypothetical protein
MWLRKEAQKASADTITAFRLEMRRIGHVGITSDDIRWRRSTFSSSYGDLRGSLERSSHSYSLGESFIRAYWLN